MKRGASFDLAEHRRIDLVCDGAPQPSRKSLRRIDQLSVAPNSGSGTHSVRTPLGLDGWGASSHTRFDFADARAKLKDAPRFIYVGPRRSLTGLNADQWIASRPGGELAIANSCLAAATRTLPRRQVVSRPIRFGACSRSWRPRGPTLVMAGGVATTVWICRRRPPR